MCFESEVRRLLTLASTHVCVCVCLFVCVVSVSGSPLRSFGFARLVVLIWPRRTGPRHLKWLSQLRKGSRCVLCDFACERRALTAYDVWDVGVLVLCLRPATSLP